MEYKKTLNLPKTSFPIKANTKVLEEELLNFWEGEGIYRKIQDKNKDKKKYILHDGPPYPNGDIHLGHALNKILKDIVVKYKSMTGFHSPFIPGWDCHGLPIETQLLKELGSERRKMDIVEFRARCAEYAMKYVDTQRREFKRLGVLGEWENPYLTLNSSYEERIIELFGRLAEAGYVYRGLKPIHWCPQDETALAEAEIEYEDDKSYSIYVKFKVKKFESKSPQYKMLDDLIGAGRASIIIWTTTPWTLPANVAVALHPEHEYVALKVNDEVYIVAEGLLEDFVKRLKLEGQKVLTKFKGKNLEGTLLQHPFVPREVVVVLDEMVTLEQGTGAVHIAPGHGEEDYKIGKEYNLPILTPVDSKGFFTSEAGKYAGMKYDEGNKVITDDMKENGSLIHLEFIKHSYPHCWRCKKPVIFRATEQWFVSVEHRGLREAALKAIGDTKWFPDWGETRIRGMVEVRPDWCISRQRSWGIPIPVFYCKACGKPHMTGKFNEAIRKAIGTQGSSAWFSLSAEEILPKGTRCPDCGDEKFEKEKDILDVWFESGASHWAVLHGSKELKWPADLYLEGSDQHRGWFQTSLLTSVATEGRAPYDAVLTHGFTVDEAGKKMSKSLGNVVDPQKVVQKYGADVLRLWVASADFRVDITASDNILKHVAEAFSKIRNTCRFLISNLYDFDPAKDKIEYGSLEEIDKWALLALARLTQRVTKAYDDFEFHIVFHSLRDFCVNEMSAFYLDISKDRLYCDAPSGRGRRSAQTAMHEMLRSLTVLFAPVLSFTAEDIWRHVPGASGSVFMQEAAAANAGNVNEYLEGRWVEVRGVREEVYREMEKLRADKAIASSLEADVELYADEKILKTLKDFRELSSIFICSRVKLEPTSRAPSDAHPAVNIKGLSMVVKKSGAEKCERCWNLRESVGKNAKHPTLCDRCLSVVESIS